jgi:hypothetical protein
MAFLSAAGYPSLYSGVRNTNASARSIHSLHSWVCLVVLPQPWVVRLFHQWQAYLGQAGVVDVERAVGVGARSGNCGPAGPFTKWPASLVCGDCRAYRAVPLIGHLIVCMAAIDLFHPTAASETGDYGLGLEFYDINICH